MNWLNLNQSEINGNSAWLVTLALFCFILMFLSGYEFYMYYLTNKYGIYKKQQLREKGFWSQIVVFIIAFIIAIIFSVLINGDHVYNFAFHIVIWWLLTIQTLILLVIRYFMIKVFNRLKHHPVELKTIDVNVLYQIYNIKNYKQSLSVRFAETRWLNNLKQDLNQLEMKIRSMQNDQAFNNLIPDLIIFLERYTLSILPKRRDYAVCLFIDLIKNAQNTVKNWK